MSKKKLLYVVNDASFFLSHRLEIAEGARDAGYEVYIATADGPSVEKIGELGFKHIFLPLSRSGSNLLRETRVFFSILFLFWNLKPYLVHLVTIKPVIYGGIAARLSPVKGCVAAISGLGFMFVAAGKKAKLRKLLVLRLYRLALGHKNLRIIFQNIDDRELLLSLGVIRLEKVKLVRGSGVNLEVYRYKQEQSTSSIVCMAARLLYDKGVREFIEAAVLLRHQGVRARFLLVGDTDPGNPATLTAYDIERIRLQGIVELLGYRDDINEIFSASNIIVLPSYREGFPKVLMEAAACGRAVVTTDVPGCRNAIDPNVTGLLVPARDSAALAEAIKKLLEDPVLRHKMGLAGRNLAEREFTVENVVAQHLIIYKELI